VTPGISGSLVSDSFAREVLPSAFEGQLGEADRDDAHRRFRRLWRLSTRQLGPVSCSRSVYDVVAAGLGDLLGFQATGLSSSAGGRTSWARLRHSDGRERPTAQAPQALFVSAPWSTPLESVWRESIRQCVVVGAAWGIVTNGRSLRLADARRTYARRFVEFDLELLDVDASVFALFWAILRSAALDGCPSLLDRIVEASADHGVAVCRSLRTGVLEALGDLLSGFLAHPGGRGSSTARSLASVHEQSLTVVYRLLFLLFAESRGLLPLWQPVYRESYSIDAVRCRAERPGPVAGLWETLQAIWRLAHNGCRAGSLRVTPFNGRLFAPSATPLGESGHLDDETARRVVLALTTSRGRHGEGRARISYRDLGVEQLGAVYESVLDYAPREKPALSSPGPSDGRDDKRSPRRGSSNGRTVSLEPGSGVRKATGTFYTPRSITDYLVRRTLQPLVANSTPDEILQLRVLDPAMGSGAFLVAACHYLAWAYEAATARQVGFDASDITERDRRTYRRLVAQHCLYGVDRNPMAVHLARLSLWLVTLAPDRPLTFLDHHLRVGDSLVGGGIDDLRRAPPGVRRSPARPRGLPALPLFGDESGSALRDVLPLRARLADEADDTLAAVRNKERLEARLTGDDSPLAPWKRVADLWCGMAFRTDVGADAAGVFHSVSDEIIGRGGCLPPATVHSQLETAAEIAREKRFFHWPLEFPEVFYDRDGLPRADGGFDVVVGNPPWDMVRADNRLLDRTSSSWNDPGALLRYARTCGHYPAQGDGHANLYQLFVERAFDLAARGGRIGLVVPWGLASDRGCSALRRMVFDQSAVDSWVAFDNSEAIFPIHRSLRFLVFTATRGSTTESFCCRMGERDPSVLDAEEAADACRESKAPVVLSRRFLERISPEDLAVPNVRDEMDVHLLDRITEELPPLCAPGGWHVSFGRELNASDDKPHFRQDGAGLPVLEGKHIEPFRALTDRATWRVPEEVAARLIEKRRTYGRSRLAYRDVASATNRLTLIAAIVPVGCVTVHTLFCLKSPLPNPRQETLCALLNSLVANYLVRLRVTTHVSAGIMAGLPVPCPPPASPAAQRLARLSISLRESTAPLDDSRYVELQAICAELYGLNRKELQHVLGTFPLLDGRITRDTVDAFDARR
jgi:hypothetical protein